LHILSPEFPINELKKAALRLGFRAMVVKNINVNDLTKLKGPVIVYFEPAGRPHFSVLKYMKGNRVFLADPAKGNIKVPTDQFAKEWHGIILAIDRSVQR